MNPILLLTAVILSSCLTTSPRDASQSAQVTSSQPSHAAVANDPFPAPKEGISIKAGTDGDTKLAALLNDFSRVTGNALLITKDTRSILENTSTGLNRSLDVAPQDVYPVVESILVHNDFVLALRNDHEPRLIAVFSLNQNIRGGAKEDAIYVPSDQIAQWIRHPAFLVTTVLDLEHSDVRTLSNSLRAMFTDQNTQQIVPVGNSNALVMTGKGAFVANLAALLRATDEFSRLSYEEAKKNAGVVRPPPAPGEPATKESPTAEARPK
jgi:hypothetical protein